MNVVGVEFSRYRADGMGCSAWELVRAHGCSSGGKCKTGSGELPVTGDAV